MVAVLAFGWFALLPDDYARLGKHILGGATFVSNFVLYFESGYWDTASHTKPLLHLWSLGVEEQFYLAFPIIIYLLWKVRNRLALSLILLFVVSFALNLLFFLSNPELDFYMPFTRFWELLAGVILAYFTKQGALDRLPIKWATMIGTVGLILLIASIWTINDKNFPGYKALMPVIGAVLFIAAGRESVVNRYLFSLKPIVFVGLISYPLYLWHWSLISYASIILGNHPEYRWLDIKLELIALSFVLAILTYYFIEKPIRFGKNYRGAKAIVLLCTLLLVGTIGTTVYIKDGLPMRGSLANQDMKHFKDILQAIGSRPVEQDAQCKAYTMLESQFCRYNNINGKSTVAVIGDSHALYAYEAVAKYNETIGVNTIMIGASGGHAPFFNDNSKYMNDSKALQFLEQDTSIKKVFIILFSTQHLYGESPYIQFGDGEYERKLQELIDKLNAMNKQVYLVAENPLLPFDTRNIISPFSNKEELIVTKAAVLERQKPYLEILQRIKGATIIPVIDVFCPTDQCLIFNENGLPLYSDNDHLSINAGGNFLINHALKPYLDK
ncbi:hypothetical protein FACS1894103_1930 [Campylobacterota bacterium]|nr:hypothetical protein FACS1894103_1930 [Campylobacterota bacterium]